MAGWASVPFTEKDQVPEACRREGENGLGRSTFQRQCTCSGQGMVCRLKMVTSTSILFGVLKCCNVFL